jgi:uncharacterized protein YjbI with pentapeptide repeats/predicted negative regulator of RcsB-dependent stress response
MSGMSDSLPRRPTQQQLDQAELSGAELSGRVLRGLSLRGRDLRGARLVDAILVGADLSGADLSDADLSDAELDRAALDGADLSGATLLRVRADGASFADARLEGARFVGAIMARADFSRARLAGADLKQARIEGIRAEAADFRGARLGGAELDDGELSGASFVDADLTGATLERVSAFGADFSGANLLRARLDGAKLEGALLDGADLRRAVLSRADLSEVRPSELRAAGLVARKLVNPTPELLALLERDGARVGEGFFEGLRARVLQQIEARSQQKVETPPPAVGPPGAPEVSPDEAVAPPEAAPDPEAAPAPEEAPGLPEPAADEAPAEPAAELAAEPAASTGPTEAAEAAVASPETAEAPEAAATSPEAAEVPAAEEVPAAAEEPPATAAAPESAAEPPEAAEAPEAAAEAPAEVPEAAPREVAQEVSADASPEEAPGGDADAASDAAPDAAPAADGSLFGRLLRAAAPRGRVPLEELVPGADLVGRDLRRMKLAGLDLRGADLSDARLEGADLGRADLTGARLDRARLDRARLSDAVLAEVRAEGARFDDAVLRRADLRRFSAPDASFIGARFDGARFEGASLVGADLSAARLADVDLADTDLSGALLEQTDLAGAELSRAAVKGAELDGALGLSAEALDGLEARGARLGRFSLGRLTSEFGTGRFFRAAAVLGAVGVGGYLVYRFVDESNRDVDAIEQDVIEDLLAGDLEQALERYQRLIEASERAVDRVTYRFEMAAVLEEAGRYDEAVTQLEEAIAESAEEPELQVEARLKLAATLAGAGRSEAAIAAYEALAGEDIPPAELAQALLGLSQLYADAGDPERALEIQQEVLKRYPNNPGVVVEVNTLLAERLSAAGEYEEALAALERIEDFPLDDDQRAGLIVSRARIYADLGESARSLEIYKALRARYPTWSDVTGAVLVSIAGLLYRQGDLDGARAELARLETQGGAPEVVARGLLLGAQLDEEAGALDEARARYERVISEFSADEDALVTARLGLARLNPEGFDLAALTAQMGPDMAAEVLLGQAQERQDVADVEAARALYQRVVDEFPEADAAVQTARFQLAALLAMQEQYAEAINAYRALLEEAQLQDVKVVLEAAIADTLLLANRLGDAELAYSSLLTGAAADSEAAGLARIGLAQIAEARGDVQRARRLYQEVVDEVADPALQSRALEALAGSYLDAGRDEEAMQAYRRFLASLPAGHDSSYPTRRAIAGILERRGEVERALKVYEELVREDPNGERRTEVEIARAELLETRGEAGQARAAFEALLDGRPMDAQRREDAILGLVRTTVQGGDAQGGLALIERYDERLTSDSARVELLGLKERCLRTLGRVQEAEAAAAEARKFAGDAGDDAFSAQLVQASELLNEGEYEQAIALYQALIEEVEDRPTVAALENSVAQARLASGDLEAAERAYQAVLDEFADLAEARFTANMGLADIERAGGEPEAALKRYRGLNAPDAGSDVWRIEQMAQASSESGDDAGAEELYKDLIRDYAGEPTALAAGRMGLAHLLRARDEILAARDLYLRVAAQAPDPIQREWARLHAANTFLDGGEPEEALAALAALSAEATDPEVLLQARLGQSAILLESGRADEGLALLEGVDAGPLGPAWVASLVQHRVACLSAMDERERARKEWRSVLERWGDLDDAASQARLGLGDLAAESGDYDGAAGFYDAVLTESGDRFYQARALLGKASALRAAGHDADARALYSRIVEEYGDQGELAAVAAGALEEG